MKKFLLSCFVALGIGANAQVIVHESFETGTTWANFTTTNLTAFNLSGTATCNSGTKALGRLFSATATSAVILYTSTASASNGKAINISAKYHQWGNTFYPGGNIALEYAVGTSTTYTPLSTFTFSGTEEYTCSVISGTIPEGTVPANTSVKVRITTTSTNPTGGYYAFYDEVNIVQDVTAVPACTTFSVPANGATATSVRPTFTWATAAGAEFYKLNIGTTLGGSNTVSSTLSTTTYTPTSTTALAPNTVYYATVTPTNAIGDATGCSSAISFTTGANALAPYCSPILAPGSVTYPISKVTLNGVTNSSAVATGSPAHENFLSTVITLRRGTSYPIALEGTGAGTANRFGFTVFVDWNQDGDFTDADEAYFTTTPFLGGASATTVAVASNIAVPSTALLGNTRMRIKYNFNSSATALITALSNPCEDVSNGQVEDYTISVDEFLAVSDINKAGISVYPNPFTDVLKISDVKGVKSISVSDVSGREVKSLAPSAELNLSSLQSGLYIVNLKMEDGSVKTFKAIKK